MLRHTDEQDAQDIGDTGALAALVEKGLHHAVRRFDADPAIRANLERARVTPNGAQDGTLCAVPPDSHGAGGRIEFSPPLVARMRAEHKYPEWVLSATIERCVRNQAAAWAAQPATHARAQGRAA
jgi:hypothetical protein